MTRETNQQKLKTEENGTDTVEKEQDVVDIESLKDEQRGEQPQESGETPQKESLPGADAGAPSEKMSDKEQETVEGLKAQLQEQRDQYLRLMAEFDNYKRRTAREYDRMVEQANERLMCDIIEVRESLERACAADAGAAGSAEFIEGLKLIVSKLDAVLKKHGLQPFGQEGEAFDPELHDAMMRMNHDTIAADHIAQLYEKGYRLHNRVIRHAKVVVSSGRPDMQETGGEKNDAEGVLNSK